MVYLLCFVCHMKKPTIPWGPPRAFSLEGFIFQRTLAKKKKSNKISSKIQEN